MMHRLMMQMKKQKLKSIHYVHSSIDKYSAGSGSSVMIPLMYPLVFEPDFLCYHSRLYFLSLLPQSVMLWQVYSKV